jgi:hypothetical protein
VPNVEAGVRVAGLDVDARFGPSLVLRDFHRPAELRAQEFRFGLAAPDSKLTGVAFAELVRQISG